MGTWKQFLEKNQTRFLDELCDFIRIPSVSADPNHKDDVSFASRWVDERLKSAGAENVVVMPTEGHPCVYGDWRHAAENQPTILIMVILMCNLRTHMSCGQQHRLVQIFEMKKFLGEKPQMTKVVC